MNLFRTMLVALLLTISLEAQSYDRVLIPISPGRVAGGFGSEWVTDLALTNLSDSAIDVQGYPYPVDCPVGCVPAPRLAPQETLFIPDLSPVAGILFVERGRVRDLAFTLRSRDTSRGHETWGTAIPVVPEDRLFAEPFGITDVPVGEDFRPMLRLYDIDPSTAPAIRVGIYHVDPSHVEPDQTADTLLTEFFPSFGEELDAPAVAQIPLWLDPALPAGRVRIEITPLTPEREYWGFVTITHNETQFVTVLTPLP